MGQMISCMIVSYNLWLERFETGEQTKRTDDRGKDADRVFKLFPIVNNGNKVDPAALAVFRVQGRGILARIR
ncbi:hypothetical protein DEA98_25795 [Brucella pseudogrignonensis]|nr:hypothetical protein [Brucella pseudogrignonensis]